MTTTTSSASVSQPASSTAAVGGPATQALLDLLDPGSALVDLRQPLGG